MLHKSLTLLENMSGKVSYEGTPVKAVGYYSTETNKRLNTLAIHTIGFTGRIYVYGTLKLEPTDDDWAVIPLTDTTDYIEFNNLGNPLTIRDNRFVNISGGYTWLKAKMDRDYTGTIETPVPIHYNITTGTEAQNIGDNVPMYNRVVNVTPAPTPDLRLYGNIECIKLTY